MKKFVLLLALVLALFLAACGGGGAASTEAPAETDAPTEEAAEGEATESEVVATIAPTDTPAPAPSGAIADVLPCSARMVEDQGNLLRVIHRLPDSTTPVVGARRAGQALTITAVQTDATGVTWYNVSENNTTVGWLEPQYVILGADCVSGGGGAEAEATAEAEVEEATAEATEE
jgi:hypothetical protein